MDSPLSHRTADSADLVYREEEQCARLYRIGCGG